jgi:hypothetical protein
MPVFISLSTGADPDVRGRAADHSDAGISAFTPAAGKLQKVQEVQKVQEA